MAGRERHVKKSVIVAVAITVMTTVAYAQDTSPPNCPPGYQCILTDLDAAKAAAQAREQAEPREQPKKEPEPNNPVAGPNAVSIEDPNHPDPCWSLRSQYMNTHTGEDWWRFQNCLTLHNFNN
jgi:hypothetical protein